jgi:hypothetical protein
MLPPPTSNVHCAIILLAGKSPATFHYLLAVITVPFRCVILACNQTECQQRQLTFPLRSNLQSHTIEMEPLLSTTVIITGNHLAVRNAITVTVSWLIRIYLPIFFFVLNAFNSIILDCLGSNELGCLSCTFLVASFVSYGLLQGVSRRSRSRRIWERRHRRCRRLASSATFRCCD